MLVHLLHYIMIKLIFNNLLCALGYHKMEFGYVHPTYPQGWYNECKICGKRSEPYTIDNCED